MLYGGILRTLHYFPPPPFFFLQNSWSRALDSLTQPFDLLSRALDLLTESLDLIIRSFDLLSRVLDLLTRALDVKLIWKLINKYLCLKQGISSEYVMADFVCMGLLDLWGARTENYKTKNSCPQLDSNPGPFAYEATSLSVSLLVEISTEYYLNDDRVLSECDMKIYIYTCSKMFCRV